MSRLTERWGPDEGSVAGRAKCNFLSCPADTSCRTCHHAAVNNRLAEYEDKIPYEHLGEAAALLNVFMNMEPEIDPEIIDKFCATGCTTFAWSNLTEGERKWVEEHIKEVEDERTDRN